ncbi:MAG: hypothetical protein MJA83_11075 [Gammaproteobacteria bacterium]|nr:hypothetical protein [Gammaproteobacteria bacterium]
MIKRFLIALLFVFSLSIAGAAPDEKQDTEKQSVGVQQASPIPLELPGKPIPREGEEIKAKEAPAKLIFTDPGMKKLVSLAKQDLVALLVIKEESIELLEARYVTWRDSSIGCPRPSFQYMQVLSNGVRILLKADGKIYYYHSGSNTPLFRCPNPSPNEPLPYEFGDA